MTYPRVSRCRASGSRKLVPIAEVVAVFAKEIECSAEEAETVIGWVIGADSDRQTARAVRLFALRAIRQLMLPGPDRRSLRWRARYAILEHVALAVQEAVPQGLPPSGKHP